MIWEIDASSIAEDQILGSVPRSDKVFFGFSIWNFSARSLELCPVAGNRPLLYGT